MQAKKSEVYWWHRVFPRSCAIRTNLLSKQFVEGASTRSSEEETPLKAVVRIVAQGYSADSVAKLVVATVPTTPEQLASLFLLNSKRASGEYAGDDAVLDGRLTSSGHSR